MKPLTLTAVIMKTADAYSAHIETLENKTKAAEVMRGFEIWTEYISSEDELIRRVEEYVSSLPFECELEWSGQ